MTDEYGCNIEVKKRGFTIAKFHNFEDLSIFLKAWIPAQIADKPHHLSISIEGKQSGWPK